MTYTRILAATAVLSAVFSSAVPAQAKEYNLCVSCSNGQSFAVVSPTPNVGSSFGNNLCSSRGAGTFTGISQAQVIKLGGKVRTVCPQKKLDVPKAKLF